MNRNYLFILICLTCVSCGVKRRLPAGEKLYDGAKVIVELAPGIKGSEASFRKKLEGIAKPKKNKMFLGKPNRVWWWYTIGEPKKEKSFKAWLRNKIGQPPVLSSNINPATNALNLQAYLHNHGHFNSTVTGDTISTGYKIKAIYHVKVERPYMIGTTSWQLDSSKLSKDLALLSTEETVLKKGEQYDIDNIKAEAERVNTFLKDKGYYYFKTEDVIAYVDTNQQNYTTSIYLGIQPQTPLRNRTAYHINKVIAVNNQTGRSIPDTTIYDYTEKEGVIVIDSARQFKPGIFATAITVRPGNLYSLPEQNKTIARMNGLGAFKFIKTEFKPGTGIDNKALLDVFYFTNPYPKKRIQLELGGFMRTNNYSGGEVGLNWRNRNIFRGAELLSVKLTTSFEISVSDSLQHNNAWRLGAETSLTYPKLLFPGFKGKRSTLIPKTRFLASYDWIRRTDLYTEYYTHFRYEFNWADTSTREHRLTPVSITFYRSGNFTEDFFDRRSRDEKLEYTVPPSVIPSTSYRYAVRKTSFNKKNSFNLQTGFETSGFILGLVLGNNGYYSTKIFNSYFMQFVKADVDFRYARKLGEQSFLVSRIIIGASYPYGNSPFLPFSRHFIIGGANSLRGFAPRHLGPGSAVATETQQSTFPSIGGDYKLELNSEYRFKLLGQLKGALFVDAGNIWMKDTLLFTPKGQLTKDFIKEIAIDAGLGVRLDVKILIIRLDLGIPFYKPWLPEGDRWTFSDFDFGSSLWRKDNLVWNLAIGYPF